MSNASPTLTQHRATSSVSLSPSKSRSVAVAHQSQCVLVEIHDLRKRCDASLVNIRNAECARDRYLEHTRGLLIQAVQPCPSLSESLDGSYCDDDNGSINGNSNENIINGTAEKKEVKDPLHRRFDNRIEKFEKAEGHSDDNAINLHKYKNVIDESIISLKNYLDRAASLANDVQGSAHLAETSSVRVSLLDQLLIRVEEAKRVVSAQRCMRRCVKTVQGLLPLGKCEEAAKAINEYDIARRTLKEIKTKEERAKKDDVKNKGINQGIFSSRISRVSVKDESRSSDNNRGETNTNTNTLDTTDTDSDGDAFFAQHADDESWYLIPLEGEGSPVSSNNNNINNNTNIVNSSYDMTGSTSISNDSGALMPYTLESPTIGIGLSKDTVPSLSNKEVYIYGHRIIRYAKRKIIAAFGEKMQTAMATNKRKEVEHYSKLLSELSHGKKEEVCAKFVEWVCASSIAELSTLVNDELSTLKVVKNTERSHLYSASIALDHVVATLEKEEEFVKTVFHFQGLDELLRHLHERCTQHVARVIKDYLSSRKILPHSPADAQSRQSQSPIPPTGNTHQRSISFSVVNNQRQNNYDIDAAKHLDRTLEEISHLVSCCYLYVTFMTNKHKEVARGIMEEDKKKVPIDGGDSEVICVSKSTTGGGTSQAHKTRHSSYIRDTTKEGYSALLTKDNPLFEAIQELLGVYIPMQRDYFSEAVRRSQQLDRDVMEKYRLHLLEQAQAVMTRPKDHSASSAGGGGGFFSGLMGGAAGGGTTALSSIFGKPGSFTYYTGGPSHPKEFLQAVLADSTISSSVAEGRGAPLTAAIGAASAAGQSSGISPLISSVIEVSVPDVLIVDDLFYVLRIALFRAFSTKNETIASSVILAIIETISEDIADEVFHRRLGISKTDDGCFRKNGRSSLSQPKTPTAVGYMDIDPITMCNTSVGAVSSNMGGTNAGYYGSVITNTNISPRTLRWLTAAFQMKEYTLHLARDVEVAAQQYFSNSDHLPLQKASDISNLSQSQQISQERGIPIRFREQMKDMEHLANVTIQHLLEDTIAEMAHFTGLVLLEPIVTHMTTANYKCDEMEFRIGNMVSLSHNIEQTSFRERSTGGDSNFTKRHISLNNNNNNNNNNITNTNLLTSTSHNSYLSNALSVWSAVIHYLTDQMCGVSVNGGGRAKEEALESLLERTISYICNEIEHIFLPHILSSQQSLTTDTGDDRANTKVTTEIVIHNSSSSSSSSVQPIPKEMTIFGALLLDKEIRTIRSFFIENTDVSGVRESFRRLMGMCSVLIVDNISDVSAVCSAVSVLSSTDKARLLGCRVDLDQKAIAKIVIP